MNIIVRNNYDNPSKSYITKRNKKNDQEYWIYGINPVIAALKNKSRECSRLVYTREVKQRYSSLFDELTLKKGILSEENSKEALNSLLTPYARHQGVALKVKHLRKIKLEDSLINFNNESILIALDQINDPQNIGAIIRSSLVFGCAGIIIPKNNSPDESGLLAKSASGALEFTNIFRVSNLSRSLTNLKKNGFWIIGFDTEGENSINSTDFSGPIVVVMGSEGAGLRRLTKKNCDSTLSIPVSKKAINFGIESLNVSNATSVALYAINQLRTSKK